MATARPIKQSRREPRPDLSLLYSLLAIQKAVAPLLPYRCLDQFLEHSIGRQTRSSVTTSSSRYRQDLTARNPCIFRSDGVFGSHTHRIMGEITIRQPQGRTDRKSTRL